MKSFVFKKCFAVLALATLTPALEAPYLISATALSNSSVELQWRNNDIATEGYLIQRADSNAVDFETIDSVKPASTMNVVDINGLIPQTLYSYRIIAFNAGDFSDPSNMVQVRTLSGELFQEANINVTWDITSSISIRVSFIDKSNCELGYRIWRSMDGSDDFYAIADLPTANPSAQGTIYWFDSTISFNKWYVYKVETYKSDSSIFSGPRRTFTLHVESTKQTFRFNKMHELPLNTSGWSAKSGDSIIIKESNSPTGTYSVINTSNKLSPRFDGYIDSTALLSYSIESLIPVYMKFRSGKDCGFPNRKAYFKRDKLAFQSNNAINLYQITQNNLVFLDSVVLPKPSATSSLTTYNTYFNNDSLMAIHYRDVGQNYYNYFYLIGISGNKILPLNLLRSSCDSYSYKVDLQNWISRYCRHWFHGFLERTILTTVEVLTESSFSLACEVYHSVGSLISSLGKVDTIGNGYNTGYYLAQDIALTTNSPWRIGSSERDTAPTEIFAAYYRDIFSRRYAQDNNAILKLNAPYTIDNLQNIILDTLGKSVYLVYNSALVTLGYTFDPVGTARNSLSHSPVSRLRVMRTPLSSALAIILPADMANADLYFYDISGKLVDRVLKPSSNVVMWRPEFNRSGCFIVVARSGKKRLTERFIMK